MDLAGIARDRGLSTLSTNYQLRSWTNQSMVGVELFAIRTQMVCDSWLKRIRKEPYNFTLLIHWI